MPISPYDGYTAGSNWIRANQPVVVDNITALRALDKTKIKYASTKGYYTPGDGGAGEYWYDSSDTTSTDNGGTIIKASDNGRWKLVVVGGKINVKLFGAKGANVSTDDDTTFINNAIIYAQNNGYAVYIPQGTYYVSNILFGTQSTSGESTHPVGIYGDGWNTTLKARTGTSGIVFSAWSTAGVNFEDFQIDGNNIATTCIDTSWKAGGGPTVQNRYKKIRCFGCTGTVWQAKDNNDSVFDQCVISAASASICALDFVAAGGLGWIRDCIWNNGFLRAGWQNGNIQNSWGMGIAFAQNSINYVNIVGCYLYTNTNKNMVMWSESFASFQSIHSLVCEATQFIGTGTYYFDLNSYSTLDFFGCQFIGTCPTLFGTNCRADNFATIKVMFRGGSAPGVLTLNTPSGYAIESSGFINDTTGYEFIKNYSGTFSPIVKGVTTAGTATYSSQDGKWWREHNRVFFEMRVTCSGHTGTGALQIWGLPFTQATGNASASVGYPGTTITTPYVVGISSNVLQFYYYSGASVQVVSSLDLIISGSYQVSA